MIPKLSSLLIYSPIRVIFASSSLIEINEFWLSLIKTYKFSKFCVVFGSILNFKTTLLSIIFIIFPRIARNVYYINSLSQILNKLNNKLTSFLVCTFATILHKLN